MKPLIRDLTIEQYRALRHLKIEGLGRVNLITGRNNSGKSSVLEALRLLASNASPSVLYEIVRSREEDIWGSQEILHPAIEESVFEFSSLFYGFPFFSPEHQPIRIAAHGEQRSMALSIAMTWFTEDKEGVLSQSQVREQPGLYVAGEALPGLAIETDGVQRSRTLESLRRAVRNRLPQPASSSIRKLPCEYVSAYGGEQTAMLGKLWDSIALSEREQHVVEALRIVDPKIAAVSMIGGDSPSKGRTAIVRSAGLAHPLPLRSYGDGLNRLFGIILALVNTEDGLLLVDEFENGLHYSIQYAIWKTIFQLAAKLNVQVVATSHSWDAITAFQQAANETPEQGVLVRLTRTDDDIVPTVFSEEELAVAAREQIEVR